MVAGRPAGRGGGMPAPPERVIYAERARALRLPFVTAVDLGGAMPVPAEVVRRGVIAVSRGPVRGVFIAPDAELVPDIAAWLRGAPAARDHLAVTTPTILRAALMAAAADAAVAQAVERLAVAAPALSARRVVTAAQATTSVAVAAVIALLSAVAPGFTLGAVGLAMSLVFLSVTALRLIAAVDVGRRTRGPATRVFPDPPEADLPVYSVLVPIRDEVALVPQLLAGLSRLDWPPERLDIKIIVEADDLPTLAAVRRALPGPPFELVVVPVSEPRTKPKALAFALPYARGTLVTIYDAEDRPHPGQLGEAWRQFRQAGPDLACLQAPLVIDNEADGRLSCAFAVEYAALFDALLPTLARLQLPLPLGGTSNHFRREALENAGGWDPYNVTEDADLGIRLARLGYRSATLTLPTREEAPTTWPVWRNQRTRWFKGWMQTWLVHTRQPLRLVQDLGWRQTAGFLTITAGMILSAMIHPIYLTVILAAPIFPDLFAPAPDTAGAIIFWIGVANLLGGYAAMVLLSVRALRLRSRGHLARSLAWLPVYWMMMSVAAYRAAWHLAVRPFHWGKTPHRPVGTPATEDEPAPAETALAVPASDGPAPASAAATHPALRYLGWMRDS